MADFASYLKPQYAYSPQQADKQSMEIVKRLAEVGQEAAASQDPFAKYRVQYGEQLAALMADPSTITSDPGYQFRLNEGLKALQRTAAARGDLMGGRSALELERYGQDYATDYLQTQKQFLANLAGAQFAPTGGKLLYESGLDTASMYTTLLNDMATGGMLLGTPQPLAGTSVYGGSFGSGWEGYFKNDEDWLPKNYQETGLYGYAGPEAEEFTWGGNKLTNEVEDYDWGQSQTYGTLSSYDWINEDGYAGW